VGKNNQVNLDGHVIDESLCLTWKCDPEILTIYREKIPARFSSLLTTANNTKRYVYKAAGAQNIDSVEVDTLALARATVRYFNSIHQFKLSHNYGENLVNNAKIAAFTSIHITEENPIIIKRSFPDIVVGHVVDANTIMAYRFVINTLGIRPNIVPKEVVKDLVYGLQMRPGKDPELFYLTMLFLEAAYGGPIACRRLMSFCRAAQNFLSIQVP
jgi:hypothetical protein